MLSDAIFTIFRLWRRSARDTCRLQLAMLPALGCTAFRSTFAVGDDSPPLVVVQAIKPSSSYTVLISAAQSPPVDWRTCAFSDMLWSLLLVSLTAQSDDNGPLCLARCLAIGTFLFCPRRFFCGLRAHPTLVQSKTLNAIRVILIYFPQHL